MRNTKIGLTLLCLWIGLLPVIAQQKELSAAGDSINLSTEVVVKKKNKANNNLANVAAIPNTGKSIVKNRSKRVIPPRTNTLLLAEMGIAKNPEWGAGLMFGQMYRGIGWYLKGRSNFTMMKDANGWIDSYDMLPDCRRSTSSEWLMDAGMLFDVLRGQEKKSKRNHLGLYVGAGYGKRIRYVETVNEGWKKYAPNSYAGLSLDAGVIGSIYGFTMSAGVNVIDLKYMEIEVGIGWTF